MKKILFTLLIFIIIQGCLNSISQSVYSDLVDIKHSYPKAERCGECHVEIYNEWKSSKHSTAYVSKVFQEQTNNYKFSECLACHAPNTVFTENILLRDTIREEGITCAVCHLQNGKFAGPIEHSAFVLPHPIDIRTEMYRSSKLCGQCHEEAYREWQNVKEPKKTCQECHMSSVERRITQGTDFISNQLVKFEHKAKLRRHRFHLSEVENLKNAIIINIEPTTSNKNDSSTKLTSIKQVLFSLTNNLPHGIPTGGFGFRKAILVINVLDKNNYIITTKKYTFFKELKTALTAKGIWKKIISVPEKAKSFEIKLLRKTKQDIIEVFQNKVVLK